MVLGCVKKLPSLSITRQGYLLDPEFHINPMARDSPLSNLQTFPYLPAWIPLCPPNLNLFGKEWYSHEPIELFGLPGF